MDFNTLQFSFNPIAIIVGLVWTFRALAACAGTFVIFDWIKNIREAEEVPPYNRRINSAAWALVSLGSVMAWVSYFCLNVFMITPEDGLFPNIILALTWLFIGGALVMRATARAEQPRLIWISAIIISLGSFIVLSLGGRPIL